MKSMWQAKSDSTERQAALEASNQKAVVKEVLAEVDKIGAESKKNFEILQGDFVQLKELVEKNAGSADPIVNERIDKFAEALANRQAEIDSVSQKAAAIEKAMQKRIDDLEKAMKRPTGGAISEKEAAGIKKASIELQMMAKACMDDNGVKYSQAQAMEANVDNFNLYQKGFTHYLRSRAERPELTMAPDQLKSLSAGSAVDGGYTVIPAMSSMITTRLFEIDPIRSLASTETISSSSIKHLVDFGQAGYGWEAETVAGAQTTTPTFNRKEIFVHTLYAKPYASMELLEDASVNIEQWLSNHVARRFARAEGAACVSGTGVGQPRGFLTHDNVSVAGTPEFGKVEQKNMGAASSLTYNGFVDVKYALLEEYMARATWLMNRTTVAAALKITAGADDLPLWQPNITAGQPSMLLGLPVAMSTTMPTVASNALSVCLADWSEFYKIVDRLGITVLRDQYSQKPFIEFYFRKRMGGDVLNFQAGVIGKVAA